MLTIISALTIALVLTGILVLKARRTNTTRPDDTRGALLMVGVQIICGNCSGDGESPNRTYLDRHGNCAECGGHSYLLASSLALNSTALRAARLVQNRAASNGRVLPFGRRTRSEKIAV